jgi:uncharacterized protein YoxC
MSEELELVVSENVRNHVVAYGKVAKWPKSKLERVTKGEADNEPLLQAFARLENDIRVELDSVNGLLTRQMEDIGKRVEEVTAENKKYAEALNDEIRRVSFYTKTLNSIIARAKGSFFGKGSTIATMAQKAIDQIEGNYH